MTDRGIYFREPKGRLARAIIAEKSIFSPILQEIHLQWFQFGTLTVDRHMLLGYFSVSHP